MADDKTKRGSPDSKRLNKSEPYEMAYAKKKRARAANEPSANGAAGKRDGAAGKRDGAAAKKAAPTRGGSARGASAGTRTRQAAPARAKPMPVRATPKPPKEEKTAENTAPRTMKEPDAVDLLTNDHLEVSKLFKQYEKLAKKEAPAAERQQLSQTICGMLKAHTAIEEEIFYPAARQAGIEEDLLDEADIEHASAKDLIAQIEAGNPDDDHYDAKVKVLGEYITHHVVEEHTEMFTKCRRAGMHLVALQARMAERKAELLPESLPAERTAGGKGGKEPSGLLSRIGDSLFH
jgi:hypothetical protein